MTDKKVLKFDRMAKVARRKQNIERSESRDFLTSYKFCIDWCEESNIDGLVIDVGCGMNNYKQYFNNHIGIDIASTSGADIISPMEDVDFDDECAELILALGSIQFKSEDLMLRQFGHVIKWLKPGGLMLLRVSGPDRVKQIQDRRPGSPHVLWTDDMTKHVITKYNLKIEHYKEFMIIDIDMVRDRLWILSK